MIFIMPLSFIISLLIIIAIFIFTSRLLKEKRIRDYLYTLFIVFSILAFLDFLIAYFGDFIPFTFSSDTLGIILIYLFLGFFLFLAVRLEIYIKRHKNILPTEEIQSLDDDMQQVSFNLSNVKFVRVLYFIFKLVAWIMVIVVLIKLMPQLLSLLKTP